LNDEGALKHILLYYLLLFYFYYTLYKIYIAYLQGSVCIFVHPEFL